MRRNQLIWPTASTEDVGLSSNQDECILLGRVIALHLSWHFTLIGIRVIVISSSLVNFRRSLSVSTNVLQTVLQSGPKNGLLPVGHCQWNRCQCHCTVAHNIAKCWLMCSFFTIKLQQYITWQYIGSKLVIRYHHVADVTLPGPDLRVGGRAPTNRGPHTKPFVFYFSPMIDAYETTT